MSASGGPATRSEVSTPFRLEQRFGASVEAVEAALLSPELISRMAELPDLGRPELLDIVEDG